MINWSNMLLDTGKVPQLSLTYGFPESTAISRNLHLSLSTTLRAFPLRNQAVADVATRRKIKTYRTAH